MKSCVVGLLIALFAAPAHAGVKEGVDAWQAGDHVKAIAEWRGPARAGDADAQFYLAQAYKLGRGVPVDLKLAQDYYQKAAIQGHEQAQLNLGLILFQNGDRKGAMPWIQKASDRGEPRAQYVLGTALFNGDLVPRDWTKAYALMTRAAGAGLRQAVARLAQMDQYIPLVQRQQGIATAKKMDVPATKSPPTPIKAVPVPPSAPAQPPAAPAAAPGWRVQLGAFGSEAAARAAWVKVKGRAGLSGLQPMFVKGPSVTRLQAGPLPNRPAAERACGSAKAAGAPCFIIAP